MSRIWIRAAQPYARLLVLLSLGAASLACSAQEFGESTRRPDAAALTNGSGGAGGGGGFTPNLGSLQAPTLRSIRADDPPRSPGTALGAGQGAAMVPLVPPPPPPKPVPPNEFQKFVLESTGEKLPLFGAEFFNQAAGAFATANNTPVGADYRMGPGDEVQIRGWGSVDIDVRTVVDRNGLIHIPRVGPVTLAGVRSSQVEGTVRAAIARLYRDFDLSVTQGQLRGLTVYVVGQARAPGAYQLPGSATLVSALFASGGPNGLGSLRRIQVKRAGTLVAELDLYNFLSKGDKQADMRLQDGDTLVIPPALGFVALTGKVANPAVYELASSSDTLDSLLSLSGGLPVVADPKRVFLERMDPTQRPARTVESFALDAAGLKRPLRSGDLLVVAPLTAEFANAVMLRGNVDTPVRTPWKPGMKVSDLIPSRAVLMSRASVTRQNNSLMAGIDKEDTLASRIGGLVDEVNFDYAVVERVDAQKLTVQALPFKLGDALDNPQSPENLPLLAGDIVTVFSVSDVRVPQAKRQVFVRVEGEVKRPGVYQMATGESLPELIEKAGGLTPDAYVFGTAFYREEVRQAQTRNLEQLIRRLETQGQSQLTNAAANRNLSGENTAALQVQLEAERLAQQQSVQRLRSLQPNGRLMLGMSPTANQYALPALRLENQDKLVVPARPDFVSVLGSVNIEAAMIYQPGRSVADYLQQAGVTSGADVDELFILRADGSVASGGGTFTRVTSTRVLPGDIIVLPEKTNHETTWTSFIRGAKDISQIFFQFGLGAAAIQTLRN